MDLIGFSSGVSTAEQASLEVLAALPALESVRMSDVMHEAGFLCRLFHVCFFVLFCFVLFCFVLPSLLLCICLKLFV